MKAEKSVADEMFRLIFARPHGNRKHIHVKAVNKLFQHLDTIAEMEADDDE